MESPKTTPTTTVVCVDIGSVRRKRFAWASSSETNGDNPDDLVRYLRGLRDTGGVVALGFECPVWIPVPELSGELGAKRAGEDRYPWSAGAGASALATGLAQIAWILQRLTGPGGVGEGANEAGKLQVTTSRERWDSSNPSEWLLWEAFVVGNRKPLTEASKQHLADARAGIEAFKARQTISGGNTGEDAVNLLAMLAGWAGLTIAPYEQHTSLPIYGPPSTAATKN